MLFFVNISTARYPVCYAFKRTALSHRALQFHQDGRVVKLAARVRKMDLRTNAWSKIVGTMDEQEILRKAYRQYAQLRKVDHNYLVLVVYDEVAAIQIAVAEDHGLL